ncbi:MULTISPECIES: photosystem II assembly protein Psb34 [Nostocales]|uniref:Ssl1498 family light-harvesting-like protein n=3 Tax=Nostocales TaxID=1161 RepID=A0A0C1QSD3_9CYAN|nr:ssl1498 family light-harvesting-like protein [Tolypothrix bouteillei]KAF3885709.1 ssl1498 family light-harvesting-like protein [Tolypothrix bouteillei VB521301]
MPYTTEEGGRLNNFAREPKVYQAEPPSQKQQINYVILGVVGLILVGGLIFVAFSVSALS